MSGMKDCDISAMLEYEHNSEEEMANTTGKIHLLSFDNFDNNDVLEPGLLVYLQDDPFHSYNVEKKEPIIDLNSSFDSPATFKEQTFDDPKIETIEENVLGDTEPDIERTAPKKKDSEQRKKKAQEKAYEKNIVGYEAKKTINLMFANHTKYLSKKCKALGIKFREFKRTYKTLEGTISGPMNLKKLFDIDTHNESQVKMNKLFTHTFVKILRKEYLIYTLKCGKMRQHQAYIQKKNKELLYFPFRDQML